MIGKAGVGLEIFTIDGAKPPSLKSRFRLEPGRHRVEGSSALIYSRDGKHYQPLFAFDFEAKAGQSYMLTVLPDSLISDQTQVCLMEEARKKPKADITAFGAFRHPGPDAVQVTCTAIEMRPV